MTLEQLNALADRIVAAAYRVHKTLGPGLLESTYQACLLHELAKAGLRAEGQVALPVIYDGKLMNDVGYRIDILVEGEIILELKSIEALAPIHKAQLLSYMRLSGRRLGYLINFNVEVLRDGMFRRINGY